MNDEEKNPTFQYDNWYKWYLCTYFSQQDWLFSKRIFSNIREYDTKYTKIIAKPNEMSKVD